MTLAILFSPQGSQAVGMGADLAADWSSAHAVYEEADAALSWSVSELCWNGPDDRLNDTRQTQPCLVATSLACLAALRQASAQAEIPFTPTLVAGHSVGEYAALAAAGVVSTADALRLVARRGALMAEASAGGGMAAVIGLDRAVVAQVVAATAPPERLVVANDNAPGQVVISGTSDALARAQPALAGAGARRVIALKVSGAFHSPLMAPVSIALARAFDEVPWSDAEPPLVSNVTGEPIRDAKVIRELLARQVCSPVEWVASVHRMVAEGVDTFVECGPGAALTGMVRRIAHRAHILNVSNPATLRTTLAALAQPARTAMAEASA